MRSRSSSASQSASQHLHAPIYGTVCKRCGAAMTRGPSDPELCARCQRDRHVVATAAKTGAETGAGTATATATATEIETDARAEATVDPDR